jgi:hypothetical protein
LNDEPTSFLTLVTVVIITQMMIKNPMDRRKGNAFAKKSAIKKD